MATRGDDRENRAVRNFNKFWKQLDPKTRLTRVPEVFSARFDEVCHDSVGADAPRDNGCGAAACESVLARGRPVEIVDTNRVGIVQKRTAD